MQADQIKIINEVINSVAEWLACWTQAQKARVQIVVATLSGNSLMQTAHTHCASTFTFFMKWCCDYQSAARCRLFARGPVDAAAISKPGHLLPH